MKYYKGVFTIVVAVLLVAVIANAQSDNYGGTVRVGYLFLDTEGNQSLNQNTFNLYQGIDLSLEQFSYRFDNGLNFSANIRNAAFRNRNVALSASKTGAWGIGFTHNGYRRPYDFNGDFETHRYRSSGQLWWRARPWVKFFAGLGVIKKNGEMLKLFVPEDGIIADSVDYSLWSYHAGLTFQENRRVGQIEFRRTTFSDGVDYDNDRSTIRFRADGSMPLPNYENLTVNAGYQYYRNAFERRVDTLQAHTFWGGVRFVNDDGYLVRYSFIFDRARRTGDATDADNITHAVYIGKSWHRRGGVTAGYKYRLNDDISDELTGNGYSITAWFMPVDKLSLKAGYGSEEMDVDEGRTLTGTTERSNGWASARYRADFGWLRVKVQNRQMDNEDIGSSTDYIRFAGDVSVELSQYGMATGSYSYGNGEYKNASGVFEFDEHVLNGELTTAEYRNFIFGFGGMYLRSQQDLDVESFSVRFTGRYRLESGLGLEFEYSSHNFDNLGDTSPIYNEYYTDNIVRVGISYDL
ncbi:MAG: hypothetical protein AB1483_09960 [Candidatus Zixiibacteriota bacterium]